MPPVIRAKDAYYARTSADMERHLAPPPWSLREKIALSCRILADEGHESAIAGQITVRGEKPGTYWMLGFGLGFDEACKSNIVLVDDDLNLLEGEGMVNPSNRFHLWIYRHRPSVNAIVHTHPPHVSALSMIGRPLVVSHMDTSMFHDDCAYLPEWPGPPIGDEEGRIIHDALGDKRAILLAHHGQLVATATIEEACVLAIFIERAAKLQLMAEAVAPIRPLDPDKAREAHDYRLKTRAVAATFHYFARKALKRNADALD
jgi:L-fuculose-phosphate aldolase